MAGTTRTIGYNRSSNGPDRADVLASEQIVSHVQNNSPGSDFIGYAIRGYVGNGGGQTSVRYGVWSASSASAAPGSLLGQTESVNPTVSYVDGAGGQARTLNLEEPVVVRSTQWVALGIGAGGSSAGVAMYQAQDISQPNTSFYRKGISGNSLQSASGSSSSNQGQLALALFGEYNVAPSTPGSVSRSGSNERRPVMTSTFSDPNETLNNGASFDELTAHRHTVSWGGVERWSATYSANATEKSQGRSIRQIGVTVPYGTTITYTVEHRDRLGLWSPVRSATFSVSDPNNAPHAPILVSPGGTITGNLSPTFQITHRDPDGDASGRAQIQVQRPDGGYTLWDDNFATGGAASTIYRSYRGDQMYFHGVGYRWRARTADIHGEWGPWSSWANFVIRHNNRAPYTPANVTGLGTITGTRTISVGFDFSDPDLPFLPDGQTHERFEHKRRSVYRVSDNVRVAYSGTLETSSAERSNRRSSWTYTLPEWNTWYEWVEEHRDRSGAWSPEARVRVIARSGGAVDKPLEPSGKVNSYSNPGNIKAIYRNSAGIGAQLFRFRLMDRHGNIIVSNTRGLGGATVQPDGLIEMSWSGAGFPSLYPGADYLIAVAAQPIGGQWSEFSDPVEINANRRPSVPTLYGPPVDSVRSEVPGLAVRASDRDDPGSALTVPIEIYNADTDVLVNTVNATQLAGHETMFTVPSAQVETAIGNAYGDYVWRARASDGVLNSAWSDFWSFTYAAVPAVTITSPTGPTVATSQPTLAWDSTDQTHWRVRGYNANNVMVYDTGERTGGAQSHVIHASQNWKGSTRWRNHNEITWEVMVRDSSTLWGTSDALPLMLEYIPPDPLIVDIEAASFAGVDGTHYALATISQPDADEESFIRTVVGRVEITGPAGNEIPGTEIPERFEARNTGQLDFADFDVSSNQWYRWSFRYEVQSGVDVISSDPVYAETMVSWHGTLLHMPFDPINNYVWLPYGTERYEPEAEWLQGGRDIIGTGAMAPTFYSDGSDYVVWQFESTLVPREGMTPEQQLVAFRRMWDFQNHKKAPNGRPNSVTLREGRGGDDAHVTGRISQPRRRHSYTRLFTIGFEFRELQEDGS